MWITGILLSAAWVAVLSAACCFTLSRRHAEDYWLVPIAVLALVVGLVFGYSIDEWGLKFKLVLGPALVVGGLYAAIDLGGRLMHRIHQTSKLAEVIPIERAAQSRRAS